MRIFDVSSEMAVPAERAWRALVAIEGWPRWNSILPFAAGELRVGARLDMRLTGADGKAGAHRPTVIVLRPPEEVVLEAVFVHRWVLKLVHSVAVDPLPSARSRLRQRWWASGLLVPLLWPRLRRAMARFVVMGDDLQAFVLQNPEA